jgi:hypothetical protein
VIVLGALGKLCSKPAPNAAATTPATRAANVVPAAASSAPTPAQVASADAWLQQRIDAVSGCEIHTPRGASTIPLFPFEPGLAEWRLAISRKDTKAAQVAFEANQGFNIEPEASCARLSIDETVTYIRITGGKHRGKAGWTLTKYTLAGAK